MKMINAVQCMCKVTIILWLHITVTAKDTILTQSQSPVQIYLLIIYWTVAVKHKKYISEQH